MYPLLVEPNIKYVLNHHLENIKKMNDDRKNILFNLGLFILLFAIIGVTLKIKYKGKQDIVSQQIKFNEKKTYILSNLRKFQNMKNKPLTNIPYD